ncbi:uncharacterized protein LOC122530008 isoform X1 [Frieseomelitta varia]|uniref:uncharacterized protein LOC122530008 isoform X1 n=1 Tax=Frieseomelitta varia TaxID=561572 RepID=UPI001CB6AF2D|nr:uncharacterized protein LOC122530008 isoform X1 [Frieseomelitta varia]XP_043512548.1 uncharacterized protein LOC122530008 isoform X1 [Frieseomelitta varia]
MQRQNYWIGLLIRHELITTQHRGNFFCHILQFVKHKRNTELRMIAGLRETEKEPRFEIHPFHPSARKSDKSPSNPFGSGKRELDIEDRRAVLVLTARPPIGGRRRFPRTMFSAAGFYTPW